MERSIAARYHSAKKVPRNLLDDANAEATAAKHVLDEELFEPCSSRERLTVIGFGIV